jgi:hypothetical protein
MMVGTWRCGRLVLQASRVGSDADLEGQARHRRHRRHRRRQVDNEKVLPRCRGK